MGSSDAVSFGSSLLQKLGWRPGSGLGKLEDGCTDPIQAIPKNNRRGVGAKGVSPKDGLTQYTAYSDLLATLNGSYRAGKIEVAKRCMNMEQISRDSRTRIHYKFTKSKDLSRLDEESLSILVGTPQIKHKDDAILPSSEPCDNTNIVKSHLNSVEYFASKRKATSSTFTPCDSSLEPGDARGMLDEGIRQDSEKFLSSSDRPKKIKLLEELNVPLPGPTSAPQLCSLTNPSVLDSTTVFIYPHPEPEIKVPSASCHKESSTEKGQISATIKNTCPEDLELTIKAEPLSTSDHALCGREKEVFDSVVHGNDFYYINLTPSESLAPRDSEKCKSGSEHNISTCLSCKLLSHIKKLEGYPFY